MTPEQKNSPTIKAIEMKKDELQLIHDHFKSNYNNRFSSIIQTKLDETRHWIDDYLESLK